MAELPAAMRFAFADCELDRRLYELRRGGTVVRIEPKVFDVLAYLLAHRDRVVSKDELLGTLWPGEFVSDSVLPRCVNALRKAVGDDATLQRVVQTVHGRGYRFVAIVADVAPEHANETAAALLACGDTSAVFVGREDALVRLEVALRDAAAGRGRLVLLVGEPGIGKTRTAEEFATAARAHGARVLVGRCYEGAGAPAFWPWVQVVRASVGEGLRGAPSADHAPLGVDLARLLPELRERAAAGGASTALPPDQERFRLFDGVTAHLKGAARAQPLVVIVDDLHHADAASLLLLVFLARELRDARIVVIATYRDVELRRQHPLAAVLGELARESVCERLPLRGLTEADVGRFIEVTAGRPAPAALLTSVFEMTEGNPFFVGEVVRLLMAQRRLDDAEARITLPQGVREAIGRRLDGLSPECNRALTVASVVGRAFSLPVLERVAELARERLLELLEEAVAAHLVTPHEETIGQYDFSHALVRETLYEELTTPARVQLHRRVGDVLEDLHRASPEEHLDELAHHFFQAAPGGDVERAVTYAERAAARAVELLAYEQACAHYEQALHALDLAASPNDVRRLELLLGLGEARSRAGDREQARAAFWRAAEMARSLGRPSALAWAVLGFGGRGEMGMPENDGLPTLLEEALAAVGDSDDTLRARLLARLVGTPPYTSSVEARMTLSAEAVELARRTGDPDTLLHALDARAWSMLGPDHVDDRLAVAAELLELGERTGDKHAIFIGHEFRFGAQLVLGDLRGADREIDAAAALAATLRQPVYLWFATWWRASRALCDGRFEEGDRLRNEALEIGRRVQHPGAVAIFQGQGLWLALERGREHEIFEPAFEYLLDYYPEAALSLRTGEAFHHHLHGRVEEARACFEALAAHDFADVPRNEHWLVATAGLAEICARLGDTRRGEILYAQLVPFASRNIVHDLLRTYSGSVSHVLGLLAEALGRLGAAAGHYEDALAMNARIEARPYLARTQFEYARMLGATGRRGDRARARELLGASMATARALELIGFEQRCAPVAHDLAHDTAAARRR